MTTRLAAPANHTSDATGTQILNTGHFGDQLRDQSGALLSRSATDCGIGRPDIFLTPYLS